MLRYPGTIGNIRHVLLRFSEDPDILRAYIHLDDDGVGGNAEPLDRVRRAIWGMLYANDANVAV